MSVLENSTFIKILKEMTTFLTHIYIYIYIYIYNILLRVLCYAPLSVLIYENH
jgi:hypothetical protein